MCFSGWRFRHLSYGQSRCPRIPHLHLSDGGCCGQLVLWSAHTHVFVVFSSSSLSLCPLLPFSLPSHSPPPPPLSLCPNLPICLSLSISLFISSFPLLSLCPFYRSLSLPLPLSLSSSLFLFGLFHRFVSPCPPFVPLFLSSSFLLLSFSLTPSITHSAPPVSLFFFYFSTLFFPAPPPHPTPSQQPG